MTRFKCLARIACTVLCLAAFTSLSYVPAWAKIELIRVDSGSPVDLRADKIEYEEKTGVYLAEGEVEAVHGEIRVFADRLRLNANTLIGEAEGRVKLITPQQVLTGEHMALDLNTGTGKAYKSQVFVSSGHYYLRGEEIEKTGRDTYRMRQGAFTTCDGSDPAWEVTGKEMEVNLEGYGEAKDTAFRIRNLPVFWTPYLFFPAKFKRQSGLLSPHFGNSDRDGLIYSQPYFQVLGDDQDATLTLNYMSKRGLAMGMEYRYNLNNWSKGMFLYDWLPDDGQGQELFDKGQNSHPYNSRYWFRGKADHRLFEGTMNLKLDVDLVSDEDYLREFTFGHSGYDLTNRRFLRWFGRDLEPNGSLVRTSKVNLQRSWSNATFNGTVIYTDDLPTDNDRTLQEYPVLSFNATRQPVGETGLYFQMGSSYRYYYREEGSKGHIADISPQVSYPLNFNDYLSVEPSFTILPRLYGVSLDTGEESTDQKLGLTQLWRFNVNTSTYLFRVFDFGSAADPFKIKHALRPFVSYSYEPAIKDEDVALLARRGQNLRNVVSYGVSNSLTSKVMGKDEQTGEIRPLYREFLRMTLDHSFDIAEYQKDLPPDTGDNRPWGFINGRLEFDPTPNLYFEADAAWSVYDNTWQRINFQLIGKDTRGDSIKMDFRQTHNQTHQIVTHLKLAVTKEWSLNYVNHRDFREDRDLENTYEVRYEGQCWGLRFFYTDTVRDRGVFVAFTLGGFGEVLGWGYDE